MAKKIKTTFLSLDTLDHILVVLNSKGESVNIDALATNIYIDMQKQEVTKDQLYQIRNLVTKVLDTDSIYRAGNVLRVVEAIELAARTYRKHDLNK